MADEPNAELQFYDYPVITKDEFASNIPLYRERLKMLMKKLPNDREKINTWEDPTVTEIFDQAEQTIIKALEYIRSGPQHFESARAEYNRILCFQEQIHCYQLLRKLNLREFDPKEHPRLLDMLLIEQDMKLQPVREKEFRSEQAKSNAEKKHKESHAAKKRAQEISDAEWVQHPDMTRKGMARFIAGQLKTENPQWNFDIDTIADKWITPPSTRKRGRPINKVV